MNDAPRRNLPPDAEAWGRYVDEQLNLLQKRVGIAKKNIVTVSRQSALGQEAAATVTQKTEAVEHVATTALNTAEEKNKADIANYPPPSPKAGDMWYDPADGNDPKIWVDYGPERVNWAHNPGFHHDVTGWVSEGADLLWDGTRKGRLVITNETELFEGTVAFLANDPPLVGEDGPDPNADDKTLDPEEPEKVQPPGHAIPPPPPAPPLDEDDDDTPPDPGIPELGEPFTFSISVEYVGPREGVDVCLAIVVGNEDWYVSDWVTALKGTEERLELNDAPPLVGQAVFQLRVRNGAKEGDQILVSEAIIEKASEPQGPYFDGYSAGCTQEGDVAVWNGDPRWVSARDNKLLQEALDAANKALEKARAEIAQAKDDLEDQLGRLDMKQIELNANPPSGTANNGDIWWQVDAEDNIIGQWVYLDGVWVESQVKSEIIAELDVGKLRASEAVLDTAVVEKLWAEAVVTKFLTATEQIITEDVIATGAVTAPKITASEELTAKVVRGDMFEGNTFTGGTFVGTTFRAGDDNFEVTMDRSGVRMVAMTSPEEESSILLDSTHTRANTVFYWNGELFTVESPDEHALGISYIRVYDAETLTQIRTYSPPAGTRFSRAFVAQGLIYVRLISTEGPSVTPPITVMDMAGNIVREISFTDAIYSFDVRPNGDLFVLGSDQTNELFVHRVPFGETTPITFAFDQPDFPWQGTSITATDDTIMVGFQDRIYSFTYSGDLIEVFHLPHFTTSIRMVDDVLLIGEPGISRSTFYIYEPSVMAPLAAWLFEGYYMSVSSLDIVGDYIYAVTPSYSSSDVHLRRYEISDTPLPRVAIDTLTGRLEAIDAKFRGLTEMDRAVVNEITPEGGSAVNKLTLGAPISRQGFNTFVTTTERDQFVDLPRKGTLATTGDPLNSDDPVRSWVWDGWQWVEAWNSESGQPVTRLGTENLDTVTRTGTYIQRVSNNATTARNYPVGLAGYLEVIHDQPSGAALYIMQRYTEYRSRSIWVRTHYNGTWYEWEKVYDTSGTPFAQAVGTATYNSGGSWQDISLPSNRFTVTPHMFATVSSNTGAHNGSTIRIYGLNTSTARFHVRLASGNAGDGVTIRWHAMQMTPTSASG